MLAPAPERLALGAGLDYATLSSKVSLASRHVCLCRDRLSTTPTFELLPFVLTSPLPKPRKERIIVQRDELGRIVHSKPPGIA